MRPIKFRAWDKVKKVMRSIELNVSYSNFRDYELMQFTGLPDKNGKEIYEGDILETKSGSCYPVVFENGSFTCFMNDWDDYNVVGNIYENPKLLKA